MADYLAFSDLYTEIERFLKEFKQSNLNAVKAAINQVYFEMLASDPLYPYFWLTHFDDTLAAVGPSDISGITQADPGVITCDAAHGLGSSDIVSIYNVEGMTEINNRTYKVNSAPATTTLKLDSLEGGDAIDTSGFTAYSDGGIVVHRGRTLGTSLDSKTVQRIIGKPKWHDEYPMDPISQIELEQRSKEWWSDSTSRPSRFYHQKSFTAAGVETNHLLWFPGSDDDYDLRFWFEERPAKLAADANVPIMPPQFHYGIVAGTVMRLAEYAVQVDNQVIWPGIYRQNIKDMKAFNRKWWDQFDPNKGINRKPYML